MNEDIMRQLGFGHQVARIKQGLCALCGTPIDMEDFKDELSRREWRISGMCVRCQSEAFHEENSEDAEAESGEGQSLARE